MAQRLNLGELRLRSAAFGHHQRIPQRHAGDGEDVAPPLEWSGVPDGTKAFAIVVHDPDAPLVDGFTHWVAYGIPATASGLPEGGGATIAGVNSFGNRHLQRPGAATRPRDPPLLLLGVRARRRARARAGA